MNAKHLPSDALTLPALAVFLLASAVAVLVVWPLDWGQ